MPGTRTTLDNPAFAGRLKTFSRRSDYERRAVVSGRRIINDFGGGGSRAVSKPAPAAKLTPAAKPAGTHLVTFSRPAPRPVPSRQTRSAVLMRQLVVAKKSRRRRHLNAKGITLASLASILFVFGIGVGIMQFNTNEEVKAQVKTLAAQTATVSEDGSLPDNGLPSENRSSGGGNWRPAGNEPKRIKIPSLAVNARILKMGVKANGEIKTPANIFDVGWLETSAKPGEYGAMFIDGHVQGPTQPGVFVGIKKLQPGDKIQVERGDGQVFTYSVVKTERYEKDKVDMVAGLNTAIPGRPGLNLMTCDGRYTKQNGYDHRVMVFAVQD